MNLMKLHQKYILNKVNKIILIIIVSTFVLLEFFLLKPLSRNDNWMQKSELLENYENYSITFIKSVTIIFVTYLYGIYFNKNTDNYRLIISQKVRIEKFYFTKILVAMFLIAIYMALILLIHITMGYYLVNWYHLNNYILKYFLEIYLIANVYGFISLITMRIFKTLYAILIPIVLYFASEIITDINLGNALNSFFELILPTSFNDVNSSLFYHIMALILIGCTYLEFGYLVYIHKE